METQTLQCAERATLSGTLWWIDPVQSTIDFSIKHMKFATVHGRFTSPRGTIRFDRDRPQDARVEVEIDAATIDTGIQKRDDHLRSADFFDVAAFPVIAFRSTHVNVLSRSNGYSWLVAGALTIGGMSRSVELAVEQPAMPGKEDSDVITFAAKTKINRKDFGMEFNLPLEGGGLVVGDEVKIAITVQANRTTP